MLARRLGQKTKISPETIAEICKIFSGNEESFLQRNEFQESVNMIKIFIHKLRKEDITVSTSFCILYNTNNASVTVSNRDNATHGTTHLFNWNHLRNIVSNTGQPTYIIKG